MQEQPNTLDRDLADLEGQFDTLVLGIGNLLWADEGFGVRCAEELDRLYRFPAHVRLMDGGTQGLYLVHYIQQAKNLLVFDAIDWGVPAGTLKVVRGDEVPAFMGCRKMSLHQTGFQDVLAAADLMGHKPHRMTLIGVQAEELEDWGGSLRPSIRAQMAPALDLGLQELAAWGIAPERRETPLDGRLGLVGNDMDLHSYETGRPDCPSLTMGG
jgi:hydrogenase maturation protease